MTFPYFFVCKTMFVKDSQASVICSGGFGTMDEVFEALALIQTGKIHDCFVLLFDRGYRRGLRGWMRRRMLAGENVVRGGVGRLRTVDPPEAVVEIRRSHGRTDGPAGRRS